MQCGTDYTLDGAGNFNVVGSTVAHGHVDDFAKFYILLSSLLLERGMKQLEFKTSSYIR